jgi:hypothetical protein
MTTPRRDERQTHAWSRLRAWLIATAPRPLICWRCEQPIDAGQPIDLGHVIDYALANGSPIRVRLEHRTCNRAAGMALSRELTRTPRTNNQHWTTTEITR